MTLTGKAAKKGLKVLFNSDKKKQGSGAQCTAMCLDGAVTTPVRGRWCATREKWTSSPQRITYDKIFFNDTNMNIPQTPLDINSGNESLEKISCDLFVTRISQSENKILNKLNYLKCTKESN